MRALAGSGLRTLCAAAFAVAVLAWAAPSARADTIPVKSAELRIEEGEVLLNAEFEFTLNPTLEEALQRGIPLYFTLDFELTRGRWYWFDEKVGQTALTYRVSYNALTRQYRVRERPARADARLARGGRALHRARDVAAGRARPTRSPKACATRRRSACGSTSTSCRSRSR